MLFTEEVDEEVAMPVALTARQAWPFQRCLYRPDNCVKDLDQNLIKGVTSNSVTAGAQSKVKQRTDRLPPLQHKSRPCETA